MSSSSSTSNGWSTSFLGINLAGTKTQNGATADTTTDKPIPVQVLEFLCVALPMLAFFSPVTVFYRAFTNKKSKTNDTNTENEMKIQMPPLAVTSQFLNCFLFGIFALHEKDTVLLLPNAVGCVLGFIFTFLYAFKTTDYYATQYKIQVIASLAIALFAAIACFGYDSGAIPSNIGMVAGVFMAAYPAPAMARALRTNNPALLGSLWMNLAMFCCCLSWVIRSTAVEFQIAVLVSNGAGVLAQSGALLIRFLRRGSEVIKDEDLDLNDGSFSSWFIKFVEGGGNGYSKKGLTDGESSNDSGNTMENGGNTISKHTIPATAGSPVGRDGYGAVVAEEIGNNNPSVREPLNGN